MIILNQLAIFGLFAMGSLNLALGQTYSFSAPVSGWSDVPLSFGPGSIGNSLSTFGTLNETLFYDPIAQTLRQAGSISLSPASQSFSISAGTSSPPGQTGQAGLTIGDGSGTLTFDTGTQTASGGGDLYSWILSLPVSGNCSVVNNGQTNTGTVSYSLQLGLTTAIQSASPTNLVLSEQNFPGANHASQVANIGGVALYNGSDDNTYHYSWNLSSVSATPIPEPGSLAILGLGAALMAMGLKAKSRK